MIHILPPCHKKFPVMLVWYSKQTWMLLFVAVGSVAVLPWVGDALGVATSCKPSHNLHKGWPACIAHKEFA